jgi:hypothetical protein
MIRACTNEKMVTTCIIVPCIRLLYTCTIASFISLRYFVFYWYIRDIVLGSCYMITDVMVYLIIHWWRCI